MRANVSVMQRRPSQLPRAAHLFAHLLLGVLSFHLSVLVRSAYTVLGWWLAGLTLLSAIGQAGSEAAATKSARRVEQKIMA